MKILVVDDEEDIRLVIQNILEDAFPELTIETAKDGEAALSYLRQGGIHLVLSDLLMPRMDGEALLEVIMREWSHIPVVVMSAHGTIAKAVELVRKGARDFITKPFANDDFAHRITLALETLKLREELRSAQKELSERKSGRILYVSRVIEQMMTKVQMIAQSSAPVLITGESGTGKELLAKEIHQRGPRRNRALVAVNCGAFQESLLESELFGYRKGAFTGATRDHAGVIMEAHQGVLFLDEVTENTLSFQVKLLRFLQEGEIRAIGDERTVKVDTRVIAATNKDLRVLMEQGKFREDLFYRLNVIPLHLPPLRERREDILLLATEFVKRYGQEVGRELKISPSASQKMLNYPWPGNIRELENKIRQLAVLAPFDTIRAEDIELEVSVIQRAPEPVPKRFQDAKRDVVASFERDYLLQLLERHGGSPSRASETSGLDRKNLWRLLKKYGISTADFRP